MLSREEFRLARASSRSSPKEDPPSRPYRPLRSTTGSLSKPEDPSTLIFRPHLSILEGLPDDLLAYIGKILREDGEEPCLISFVHSCKRAKFAVKHLVSLSREEGEKREREREEGGRKEEGGRRKEEGGRRKEEGGRREEGGGRRLSFFLMPLDQN
jgi:hypothetical protein